MKPLNIASSILIGVTLVTRAYALDVDPKLPAYKPVSVGRRRLNQLDPTRSGI
jgi:hypothetical protein